MAGSGGRDQLPLVRHQLLTQRSELGRRCRERHARRGRSTSAFERAQQRAEQLPAGKAARTGLDRSRRARARCEEGIGQLAGGHRGRHDPALGRGGDRVLGRRLLVGRLLDPGRVEQVTFERSGPVRDASVLGEERQQPGVADGDPGEDRRDGVQALESLGSMTVAAGRVRSDAGAFLPQQQGDGLERRPNGRRHSAALDGRLDLTDGLGERRGDVAAVADGSLCPRGGATSAGPAPA